MSYDPFESFPPPPRAVHYRPFVRKTRIAWVAAMLAIALLPFIGLAMGYHNGEIGGTPPAATSQLLNARVTGHRVDSYGDAYMSFQYPLGGVTHGQEIWVPQSFYNQMASSPFAPVTVPDPSRPYEFYIGPPRNFDGLSVMGFYVVCGVAALGMFLVGGYFEYGRMKDFNLLKHGWTAVGTIDYQSGPENELIPVLEITTREGQFMSRIPLHTDVSQNPPRGTNVPVLYQPEAPSVMTIVSDIRCCELVDGGSHPPIRRG